MDLHNPDHDPASKTKICIKIKIPNNLAEASLEEDIGINGSNGGGGHITADLHDLPPGYRACEYCGKIFSSGKAWGGHKRHHLKLFRENNRKFQESSSPAKLKDLEKNVVQKHRSYINGGSDQLKKNNTINVGDVKVRDGKPTCCLCQKKFPSMQSLFGHMRFHSDRGWKGIQPPSFSDSSSGLEFKEDDDEEEAEDEEIYYNHESSDLPVKSLKGRAIDLMSSLSGKSWVKKDFRGRPSAADLIPQAARDLLTLSKAQGGLVSASNAFKDNVMEIGKKLNYITNLGNIQEAAGHNEISKMNFQESSYPVKNNAKRISHVFAGATVMEADEEAAAGSEPDETDGENDQDDHDPDDDRDDNHGMLGIDLNKPYVMQDGEEEEGSFSMNED